ncbi:MAG TPA: PrsW family glutamic-type intramembrane protease [Actinomycetota bacterium]|nr:PrsW family glutamic-type intramembrane protease [Actinomycetota bacterium]
MAQASRRRAGTVRIGTVEVAAQTVVLTAGAIVWLAIVVANTGGSGVAATWTNASFAALLLVATGLIRSIRTRLAIRLFLLGGLMLSLALIGAWVFERVVSDPAATSRDVVVPLMEETLKLAPVLYLLWRWRRRRAHALGASDVLVMAAAVGAGFALVEDAFIREAAGWARTVPLFPSTEYSANGFGERLIVGHAMWTALAGATMGLALLLLGLTARGLVVGLSGYAVSALDHMANNLSNGGHARLLNDLMLHGRLPLYLFIAATVACIAVDLAVTATALPKEPELKTPAWSDPSGITTRLAFARSRRGLAFAAHRYDRTARDARRVVGPVLIELTAALVGSNSAARRRSDSHEPGRPDQVE